MPSAVLCLWKVFLMKMLMMMMLIRTPFVFGRCLYHPHFHLIISTAVVCFKNNNILQEANVFFGSLFVTEMFQFFPSAGCRLSLSCPNFSIAKPSSVCTGWCHQDCDGDFDVEVRKDFIGKCDDHNHWDRLFWLKRKTPSGKLITKVGARNAKQWCGRCGLMEALINCSFFWNIS